MTRPEQVSQIIKKYNKDKLNFLSNSSNANKIYNAYFRGLETQTEVSQFIFPRSYESPKGRKDNRKKKVMPIINHYTQALTAIGWLKEKRGNKEVKRKKGLPYKLSMFVYKTTLNPLYEYFEAHKASNLLTRSGKDFLEVFFKQSSIPRLTVFEDEKITTGALTLLRNYVTFKLMLKTIEAVSAQPIDNDAIDKIYELHGNQEPKQTLDVYSAFFGVYANEKLCWMKDRDDESSFDKKAYKEWWKDLESFVFQNYADSQKFYSLMKLLFPKELKGGVL